MVLAHTRGLRNTLASCAAVLVAGFAGPARALPYFNDPSGFGFDNEALGVPLEASFEIPSAEAWRRAGSVEFDDGSFDITLHVRQKLIQRDGSFRVQVKWVIENQTGLTLDRVLVFFNKLAGPPAFPDFPDYSGRSFDIAPRTGAPPLDIIRFDSQGQTFFFAGWALENLAPGRMGRVVRQFRYDVSGGVIGFRGPALGVAAAIEPAVVPESSTAVLLAVAFLSLCALRRVRCT